MRIPSIYQVAGRKTVEIVANAWLHSIFFTIFVWDVILAPNIPSVLSFYCAGVDVILLCMFNLCCSVNISFNLIAGDSLNSTCSGALRKYTVDEQKLLLGLLLVVVLAWWRLTQAC